MDKTDQTSKSSRDRQMGLRQYETSTLKTVNAR